MCRILSMRVMMSSPIVLCHYLAMIDELGGGQNTLTAIARYAGKLKVAASNERRQGRQEFCDLSPT
jgi:23S rRNA A2030 N6-methylase RlmJ